jgi:hypothetical protein
MQPGADVEVRCRFDNRWVAGFIVAEVDVREDAEQVWVARRSDGTRLPVPFTPADIRRPAMAEATLRG